MNPLVFLLEEPSAKEMLQGLLPRVLPNKWLTQIKYVVFRGKQDLEKNLERKLRNWNAPVPHFIILRDQDSGDCIQIKKALLAKCAGKSDVLVRIACHELESWYLGDLFAVQQAFQLKDLANQQKKEKYRHPDRLANAAEELEKLTQGLYQKLVGSREIGKYLSLEPETNQSHSSKVFVTGLRAIVKSGKMLY